MRKQEIQKMKKEVKSGRFSERKERALPDKKLLIICSHHTFPGGMEYSLLIAHKTCGALLDQNQGPFTDLGCNNPEQQSLEAK